MASKAKKAKKAATVDQASLLAAAVLVVAATLTTASWAQSSNAPSSPSNHPDVVSVVVSVQDKKGRPVPDLPPEDFVVREDGRAQAVAFVLRAADRGDDPRLSIDLALLLDLSESMTATAEPARKAAASLLDMAPRAPLLVLFDQDIRISRYRPADREATLRLIAQSSTRGMTALYDAIFTGLSRLDASGRRVIVLLSDGEDSSSTTGLAKLLQLVRQSSVTVYPIAFTGGFTMGSNRYISARSCMTRLAEVSGGMAFTPTGSRDLPGIYEGILGELQSQYVIGFVSDNARRDGKLRKLKVELKRSGLKTRHREGYYAPKDRA